MACRHQRNQSNIVHQETVVYTIMAIDLVTVIVAICWVKRNVEKLDPTQVANAVQIVLSKPLQRATWDSSTTRRKVNGTSFASCQFSFHILSFQIVEQLIQS